MNTKYVMCIDNRDYEASLTLRRVYKVIPDEGAKRRKMIKLVDDTGGEYWFPARAFIPVELPEGAEQNFELVTA